MHGEIDIGDAVNWGAPVNRGLAGWWIALPWQQRGNIFRDLCMRNHGTLTNGPVWSGSRMPGGFGSLTCNGSSQYVNVPRNTNLEGTSLTVALWVRPTSNTRVCLCKTITSGFSDSAQLLINSTVRWQADSSSNLLTSSGTVTIGAWAHIVGTYSSSSQDIYINGVNSGTRTPSTGDMTWADTPWRIGSNDPPGGGLDFIGDLNDLRIYTTALSASQVSELYKASRQGYPNELNWLRRRDYSFQAATTNRRRRLICGAAA